MLIASIAIWVPDTLLYFDRENGNWRFTGSEIQGVPYHSPPPAMDPMRKTIAGEKVKT